ncbi:hypothetical protein INR49_014097, partial [Caranx melampygus]
MIPVKAVGWGVVPPTVYLPEGQGIEVLPRLAELLSKPHLDQEWGWMPGADPGEDTVSYYVTVALPCLFKGILPRKPVSDEFPSCLAPFEIGYNVEGLSTKTQPQWLPGEFPQSTRSSALDFRYISVVSRFGESAERRVLVLE